MKPRINRTAGYWQITQACSIDDVELCREFIKAMNKNKTQQEVFNGNYAGRQLAGWLLRQQSARSHYIAQEQSPTVWHLLTNNGQLL
jgi:hypothetical protein